MSKARFVQAVFVANRPPREKFAAALSYAEDAWDFLTRHGYGGAKADEPKPRATVDYYARLTPARRAGFDAFWDAYGHKVGKTEAALTWAKLGGVAEAEAEWIVAAARAEARRWREATPQGQTRIYAQGWLSALRWRDHPRPGEAAPGVSGPGRNVQRSLLINELAALRRLHAAGPDDSMARKITELEERLRGFDSTA